MEILFRGQVRRFGEKVRMSDGSPIDSKWVYGGIFPGNGDFSIIYTQDPIEKCPVYTDSVGQYIWRKDSGGTKIFTGDVLADEDGNELVVDMDEELSRFCLRDISSSTKDFMGFDLLSHNKYTVIGNIFDRAQAKEFYK